MKTNKNKRRRWRLVSNLSAVIDQDKKEVNRLWLDFFLFYLLHYILLFIFVGKNFIRRVWRMRTTSPMSTNTLFLHTFLHIDHKPSTTVYISPSALINKKQTLDWRDKCAREYDLHKVNAWASVYIYIYIYIYKLTRCVMVSVVGSGLGSLNLNFERKFFTFHAVLIPSENLWTQLFSL